MSKSKRFFCLLVCAFLIGPFSSAFGADIGTIQSGETLTNNLDGPSYMNSYQFYGEAGDTVIFNAVKVSGSLNTYMDLYAPSNTKETSTYPFGDQLSWKLKATGPYTIVVSDYGLDNSGSYSITFLKILGTVSSSADPDGGPIASGQTLSGSIVPSDMDAFQFYGEAGNTVIFNAAKSSGSLNTYMDLYSPTGLKEASSYPFGDQLSGKLEETGLYTILVCDYGLADAGTYSITFQKIPGAVSSPGDPNGGGIASGQALSGTINVPSDMDAYQFYGEADETAIINAVKKTGSLNTYLDLYSPSGLKEASSYPFDDQLNSQLKETGLYTILVFDYDLGHSGDYDLSLTKVPPNLVTGIYNPYPADGGNATDLTDSFSWDAVEGAQGYDLYFGEDVLEPLNKIETNLPEPSAEFPALETEKVYYWHVVAHTASGEIEGPYWWFRTSHNCIQPNAQFTVDSTSGKAPLAVSFSDQSAGDITSWSWKFGDGKTSNMPNPTHNYGKPGVYSVRLTVTGPCGKDTETKKQYITVYAHPVSDFSAEPATGKSPLKVQFTDKSIGTITSWFWQFGDGGTSESQNPAHTYKKKGNFTVRLTVKGPGGSSKTTKKQYIEVL